MADSAALRDAVTVRGMLAHLEALQAIADAHGGNRTAGSAGDAASVDYVAARLREAGYTVRFDTFTLPLFVEVRPPSLTVPTMGGPGLRAGTEVRTIDFSATASVEGPIWPAGSDASEPRARPTQGCRSADYEEMPRGALVLVRRGECSIDRKVARAAEAGAAAVLVQDRPEEDGEDRAFHGELEEPAAIPAVSLSHAAGGRLAEAARRAGAEARLSVEGRVDEHPIRNVIAELRTRDPERVVVAGAHLDSVPAGPGMNDNASGVAALLEIALQISHLGIETPNRLRFAFWGAEENGLLGSANYVASLPPAELERIEAALNFDMLGSSNYGRFVYDGDGSSSDEAGPSGSAAIERMFRAYFEAAGLTVSEIDLEDPSDHLSFAERGIPVGGLVAGDHEEKSSEERRLFGGTADAPFDPCFHEACDRLATINRTALDELADAAAHAILVLGFGIED